MDGWTSDSARVASTIVEALGWHGAQIADVDAEMFHEPTSRRIFELLNNTDPDPSSRLATLERHGVDPRTVLGLWTPDLPMDLAANMAVQALARRHLAHRARPHIVAAVEMLEEAPRDAAYRLWGAAAVLEAGSGRNPTVTLHSSVRNSARADAGEVAA